jgi:hypothetical protein
MASAAPRGARDDRELVPRAALSDGETLGALPGWRQLPKSRGLRGTRGRLLTLERTRGLASPRGNLIANDLAEPEERIGADSRRIVQDAAP